MALSVELRAKSPYRTWWIALTFDASERPDALIAALDAHGWKQGWAVRPIPGHPITLELGKRGTDLFNDWTDAERRRFKREALKVLSQHGITEYTERRLTLADLL